MTSHDKLSVATWATIICGNVWAAAGNAVGTVGFLTLAAIGVVLTWKTRK